MKRTDVKNYLEELRNYLKGFEEKTGLRVEITSTSFSTVDFTSKITFSEISKEDEYNTKNTFFGKYPYGTKVNVNGKVYEIVGYNARSYKYPYQIKNSTSNQGYKVSGEYIEAHRI